MESVIVRRIALTGALRGSAVLTERGGKTDIEISLRGLKSGASLFTVAGGSIEATPVSGEKLTVPQTGICAAVIAENGRLITGGFTGGCAKDRKKLLDEIRIRSAESAARPAQEAPPPAKKPEAKHRSPVTGNILETARGLFSMLEGLEAIAGKSAAPPEETGSTEVPNPFPRTFPNSTWRKKDGDNRLFGSVVKDGRVRSFVAVPVDLRFGNGRVRGARTIIVSDGRRYIAEALD